MPRPPLCAPSPRTPRDIRLSETVGPARSRHDAGKGKGDVGDAGVAGALSLMKVKMLSACCGHFSILRSFRSTYGAAPSVSQSVSWSVGRAFGPFTYM